MSQGQVRIGLRNDVLIDPALQTIAYMYIYNFILISLKKAEYIITCLPHMRDIERDK